MKRRKRRLSLAAMVAILNASACRPLQVQPGAVVDAKPIVVYIDPAKLRSLMDGSVPLDGVLALPVPGRATLDFSLRSPAICPVAADQQVWDGIVPEGVSTWHLRVVGGAGHTTMLLLGDEDSWIYSVADAGTGQMQVRPLRPPRGARCALSEEDQRRLPLSAFADGAPVKRNWPAAPRRFRFAVSATYDFQNYFKAQQVANENLQLASLLFESALNVALCPVIDPRAIEKTPGTIYGGVSDAQKRVKVHKLFKQLELQFDLGQVFDVDGDSWGDPGSLCKSTTKDNGITNWQPSLSENVWVLAHEASHQLGATHTFDGNISGRDPRTAVEPGAGRSVLGYANDRSTRWFHPISVGQLLTNVSMTVMGNPVCGTPFGVPAPSAPTLQDQQVMVPQLTPFRLVSDSVGAVVFSMGEVTDPEPEGVPPPWFSARPETRERTSTFPLSESALLSPFPADDRPPSVAQPLKFLALARDARGSIGFALHTVDVVKAGPFAIPPQTNWRANSRVTLLWSTGKTETPPLSASDLELSISTDDGKHWRTLKDHVKNNGRDDDITLGPQDQGTQVRVRLTASQRPFFAVSQGFTVAPAAPY